MSGTWASYTPTLYGRHQSRDYSKPAAEGKAGGSSRFDSFCRDGNKTQPRCHTPVVNTFSRCRRCSRPICNSRYHFKAACEKVTVGENDQLSVG